MKSINSFFKLKFNSRKYSEANLIAFTKDHINRLSENNKNHRFNDIIINVSLAYDKLKKSISDKTTIEEQRKIQNTKVKYLFDEIKDLFRRLEAYTRCHYTKHSAKYQNYFPYGLTELSRFNQTTIIDFPDRLLNLNYEKGSPVYKELLLAFEEYKSEKQILDDLSTEFNIRLKRKNKLKDQLCKQLQKSLHAIAINSIDNLGTESCLFNTKLLYSGSEAKSKCTSEHP